MDGSGQNVISTRVDTVLETSLVNPMMIIDESTESEILLLGSLGSLGLLFVFCE